MPHISCTRFSAHLLMNHVIGCQVSTLTPISLIGNLGLEGGVLRLRGLSGGGCGTSVDNGLVAIPKCGNLFLQLLDLVLMIFGLLKFFLYQE